MNNISGEFDKGEEGAYQSDFQKCFMIGPDRMDTDLKLGFFKF